MFKGKCNFVFLLGSPLFHSPLLWSNNFANRIPHLPTSTSWYWTAFKILSKTSLHLFKITIPSSLLKLAYSSGKPNLSDCRRICFQQSFVSTDQTTDLSSSSPLLSSSSESTCMLACATLVCFTYIEATEVFSFCTWTTPPTLLSKSTSPFTSLAALSTWLTKTAVFPLDEAEPLTKPSLILIPFIQLITISSHVLQMIFWNYRQRLFTSPYSLSSLNHTPFIFICFLHLRGASNNSSSLFDFTTILPA